MDTPSPQFGALQVRNAVADLTRVTTRADRNKVLSMEQLEQQVRFACGELGRRLRAGESVAAEDYLLRHPQIAANSELALELIYTEFIVREELNQPVSSDDWLTRFPQWRNDLQQLFEVHQQVCNEEANRSTQHPDRPGTEPSKTSRPHAKGSALEVGRVVGNYQLLEELGRGGMGVVFRARQVSLNRHVALKMILSGEFASPRELARFQTEAEAAARLQHPNIVQVYEVGAHDGRPFLSMELVDGGSLEDRLKHSPPAPRESATLLETIARAVHFAHERAVVHCDLKPSNVLLDAQGVPKVADFGLAKQLADGKIDYTHSGGIIGTPCYMAPEQARGKSAKHPPAPDLYTNGTMLYELLTGKPPFLASTPLETLRMVTTEDPSPPSRFHSTVPRDLETICLKCLEKDSSRRYASAGALADDLRRFLHNEPIRARSVNSVERLAKWVRRRPALALLIASLAVSLASVSTLWRISEVRRQESDASAIKAERSLTIAEKEQQRAEGAAKRAEQSLYFHRIAQAQSEWKDFHVDRANRLLEQCPAPVRDWEWRYLKSLCNTQSRLFHGHTEPVRSVAISPDGKTIASGTGEWGMGKAGEIILWDMPSGKPRATLKGHKGPIMDLEFSPDSQKVLSASAGFGAGPGGVKIWNLDGEELLAMPNGGNNAYCAIFSPDGSRVAVGCVNAPVRIYDIDTGKQLLFLAGHRGSIHQVSFSPDGNRVASVSRDGSLRIWNLMNGTTEQLLSGYGDLRQVSYSPDGRFLAFCGYGEDLFIWELSKPSEDIERRSFEVQIISALVYSPEGRRMALSGRDGSVRIIDAASGNELKRLHTHDGVVYDLAFSSDGRELVTSGIDGSVKVWDAQTDWNDEVIPVGEMVSSGSLASMAVTKDGDRLLLAGGVIRGAQGSSERLMIAWDVNKSCVVQTFRGHTDWLTDVAVTRDGTFYATASRDKSVRLWNAASGIEERQLIGHTAEVLSVAFDPRGGRVVSACADGSVRVWDRQTGATHCTFKKHTGSVIAALFCEDGEQVISAGDDKSIRIWNATSREEIRVLEGHASPITSIALSHNESLLASASQDGLIRIWDVKTGALLHVLHGHRGLVTDVSFSIDDKRLASSGTDMSVHVWDVETGDVALSLRVPSITAAVLFHPDGNRLMSVYDRTLRIWDAAQPSTERLAAAFDDANLAWHQREIARCLTENHHLATTFHLDHLIRLRPDRPGDYIQRGEELAELGKWELAAADFLTAIKRGTSDPAAIADLALVQLNLGRNDAFHDSFQRLLQTIDPYSPVDTVTHAVMIGLLAPDLLNEPGQLVTLANRVANRSSQTSGDTSFNVLGAALFRNGGFDEARQAYEPTMNAANSGTVEDWLFLAMIESREGHKEQALEWLNKSKLRIANQESDVTSSPRPTWKSRLRWKFLLREAESAIKE